MIHPHFPFVSLPLIWEPSTWGCCHEPINMVVLSRWGCYQLWLHLLFHLHHGFLIVPLPTLRNHLSSSIPFISVFIHLFYFIFFFFISPSPLDSVRCGGVLDFMSLPYPHLPDLPLSHTLYLPYIVVTLCISL